MAIPTFMSLRKRAAALLRPAAATAGPPHARVTSAADWEATRPWIDLPGADVDGYAASAGAGLSFDLSTKLREWRERGIVIFEGAVASELIDAYLADLQHLKDHHRDFDITVEHAGTHRPIRDYSREELDRDQTKLNSVHVISSAACRLSLTREVCQFLAHVFRSPPCVLQSLTFTKGSQQPIHIDYPYVRTQTRLAHLAASWIPLEDVDPRSGPLAYYPGSHRPEVSGFFDWGKGSVLLEPDSARTPEEFARYLAERMRSARIQPEVFCPKKGDVLIWHANLAHEGTAIQDPTATRRSYVTHYTSLAGYPADYKLPDAIETGACHAQFGGYAFDYPWALASPRLPSWKLARAR